jgi:two-component system, NtrC family, sensor kinase
VKSTNNNLSKEMMYYESLINNTRIGFYQVDTSGNFLNANPALFSILGIDPSDKIWDKFFGYELDGVSFSAQQLFERLRNLENIDCYEIKITRPGLNPLTVLLSGRTVKDSRGKTLYYEGFLEDITDSKKNEENLKKVNTRLEILSGITEKLSHLLELDDLLHNALSIVLAPLNMDGGGVLFRVNKDMLEPVSCFPIDLEIYSVGVEISDNPNSGFSGRAAYQKKVIIINDTHDPDFVKEYPRYISLPRHCFAILPILNGDNVLGVLNLFLNKEINYFDEETISFLTGFINQFGIFINNANLHDKLSKKLKKLDLLYDVANKLSKYIDLDKLIEQSFSIFKELNFTASKIYLLSQDKKELILFSFYNDAGDELLKRIKVGSLFSGLAVTRKTPIVINDSFSEEAVKIAGFKVGLTPHSFASFPLLYHDECKGVLNLAALHINSFDNETRDLCENIAKQLSIALNNAELHDQTIKKLDRLTKLYDIAYRLSNFIEFDKLVLECFSLFKELGFYGTKLYLVSADGAELTLLSSSFHIEDREPLVKIEIGELFSGIAAKNKKHFIINDSRSEEAYSIDPMMKTRNPHSFASFPIIYNDKCLGVLNIASLEINRFDDEIIDFCNNITTHLAIILNNAKLYNEVLKRNKELKNLNALSYNLTQNMGLEEACIIISKQIEDLFNYDGLYIDLYNNETGLLSNVINIDTVNNEKTVYPGSKNRKITSQVIKDVINQKRPILILREKNGENYDGLATFGDKSKRAASLMFAPLIARGEILGIISVQSYRYQAFNERDKEIFTNLAQNLGVSIKNILLYQSISESENQYKSLIENLPDSIYSLTLDGIITALNSKTYQLLDIVGQNLVGCRALDFVPQNLKRIFLINFKRVIERNDSVSFEFKYQKEARNIYFLSTLAPIKSLEGKITNIIGIARDITIQKESESYNLKLHRQEAESKRQELIVNMTRNIAHVFNNILVNVLSRSSFAKSLIDSSNVAYSHLEKIELSSKRFSELVKQLLDFSQSGKFKFELTDLNKTIQFYYLSKRVQLRSNIELKIQLDPNLYKVEVDRDQIVNILEKILSNSAEALKTSGEIIISTENFKTEKEIKFFKQTMQAGLYVLLKVHDNGEGINEGVLERFFEPFNTTKEYGRGLGLPGVYGIILNLSGFINIISKPQKGTDVELYFKVKE